MAAPPKYVVDTKRRLNFSSEVKRRLSPDSVAATLNAEIVGPTSATTSPVTFHAVREEIFRRLRSSGGRPSLAGAERRPKIPMSDGQWSEIEALAKRMEHVDFHPTPGQVASALLSVSLRHLDGETVAEVERETRRSAVAV